MSTEFENCFFLFFFFISLSPFYDLRHAIEVEMLSGVVFTSRRFMTSLLRGSGGTSISLIYEIKWVMTQEVKHLCIC